MIEPEALLAVGLAVGFVVGLTSMGGATLMTPFLILALGVKPHIAVGTDVVYASLTKIVGALMHWRQKSVDVRIARTLALGSVPGGIAGALASYAVGGASPEGERFLRVAIGVTLLVVTAGLAFRGRWTGRKPVHWRSRRRRDLATAGWGALIGAVVGFTSIGSGTLVLPFLIWAYDAPASKLVGSNIFHAAILLAATGGLFAGVGIVQWNLLPWLLAGSLPGVAFGSRLAPRMPERILRPVLMLLLLVGAWKLMR